MRLRKYHKKRNFSKTPEPKGKISHHYKNLFVVQKHAASHLHYDLRLELHGVLLSWAVPKGPCLDPSVKRLAMHVEDHPVEYGSFEGIIPEGEYGAGTVLLWDTGQWHSEDKNPTQAYHSGHLRFTLDGEKLKGRWSLIKFKSDNDKSWFFIKVKDKYAKPLSDYDITVEEPNSVVTNQSIVELADNYEKIWSQNKSQKIQSKNKKKISSLKKITLNLPKSPFDNRIYPELATLVNQPPTGDAWLHEIKLDGYRIIACKNGENVQLFSRRQKDWGEFFPNVLEAVKHLPINKVILDGEVVVLDKNHKSNFQLLQNAIKSSTKTHFIYYIFDLIYYKEFNLTSLPLVERKEILQKFIETNGATLRYNDHIIGRGNEVFAHVCQMGLEGILSKRMDSPYEQKRSKSWLKIKCLNRQEFVVGGYSNPKGGRGYFGSLYLGVYNTNKELVYCGNVGTGFNSESLKSIYQLLQKYKTKKNPFNKSVPGVKTANWVLPKLVAEVEFLEWTKDGLIRQGSFKGLRNDKPAEKIIREQEQRIENMAPDQKLHVWHTSKPIKIPFKLTNSHKILYPEDKITKLDLANYYNEIKRWILPYITNRPLTLVRCPESYKKCFYQKHITESSPKALHTIPIKEKNEIEDGIYIDDFEGLMSLIQLGTLEIHPWGSRIKKVEYPDMIIFDLDPAPDVKWKQIVDTALLVRDQLADYKLTSFVKTTGGKGLHIVVPIKPEYEWDIVKEFAHVFVKFLVATYPTRYVGEMSKHKRKGKIFIDYLRNQRGATAIAAYSTRARQGAPVSTPLGWDELSSDYEENVYTIFSLPARLKKLKKDPWANFFKIKQSLGLDKL